MDGYYFTAAIDEQRFLCLSPLTDRTIERSGEEIADPSGHWLYEQDKAGNIELIAQVTNAAAVWRLRNLLGLS